nr:DUF1627 domain-containing protein [Pantoea cypripedii]
MNSVLEVVKSMGSATALEIAARMDITPRDAISMLHEQRDLGILEYSRGAWRVVVESDIEETGAAPAPAPAPMPVAPPVQITEVILTDFIRENGPHTVEALATKHSTTARKIASTLAMATNKGRLQRLSLGGKFHYALPEVIPASRAIPVKPDPVNAVPVAPAEPEQARGVASLEDIPTFIGRPLPVEVPSLTAIAREIRNTRTKLKRLERLRSTVRDLKRQKSILNEIMG